MASLFVLFQGTGAKAQFFSPSVVDNISQQKWTSLDFGPDGRLYATTQYGQIRALTINRRGSGDYAVVDRERIDLIEKIPQRSDEDGAIRPDEIRSGSSTNYELGREVTGILVVGTPNKPIIYVSSSDVRIGGSTKGDVGICTNSGIISRLTWKHSQPPASTNFSNFTSEELWDKVDIVRGLPRSEENHATNGLQLANVNGKNYLFVCSGGNTNAGAPSLNFTKITEFALGAAILVIDLDKINMMEQALMNTGGLLSEPGSKYVYDIPTVDDPTRANVRNPDYDRVKDITPGFVPEFEDPNDPWGGNDGLNQAKLIIDGPVQIWSPGYRNAYDIVVTQDRRMYATDNGANPDWGGFPKNEAQANVTNEYPIANGCEPGGSRDCKTASGENVNNKDHLAFIGNTTIDNYVPGSYYGGHPCPIRANPNGAGLYTSSGNNNIFRSQLFQNGENDPNKALPADWPPIPPSLANPIEGDFQNPGTGAGFDNSMAILENNSNGICEYTASNSNNAFKGDLLVACNKGTIFRIRRNADGSLLENTTVATNLKNLSSGFPLDVASQGDGDIFAGTIWVAMYNGNLLVLEPNDFDPSTCLQPDHANYAPNADYDEDGYTNDDEVMNNTNHCDPGSQPADFDGDKVSNLNDPDDDEDGTKDLDDPFQIGFGIGQYEVQNLPVELNLFAATGYGFEGVGFTGLMINQNPSDSYTNWIDTPGDSPANDVIGGAAGIAKIYVTPGTSENNDQEKAYQFGVRVGQNTGLFRVRARLLGPFHQPTTTQSYGTYIGNGDQDNYVKLVLVPGGIQLVEENDGDISKSPTFLVSGLFGSQSIDLYFFVDPITKRITPAFSTNDGVITELQNFAVTAEGALAEAIQQEVIPLAVGTIGTQGNSPTDYSITYDLFEVKAEEPYVSRSITDVEVAPGSDALGIFLDNHFEDDNGDANLTYTIEQNKANGVNANINNNILFLNFPAQSSDGDITIRATDNQGNFVEDIFNVRVTTPPIVAYRNNFGGVKLLSEQGKAWTGDSNKNPTINLVNPSSNNTRVNVGSTITQFDPSVDRLNQPNTIGIYATNRESTSKIENMKFQFDIPQEGNYEIRFYFGNNLTNEAREFNIIVNGQNAIANLNPITQYGYNRGGVAIYNTYLTQSILNIEFNPVSSLLPYCSAIEVLQQTGPVAGTGAASLEVNANSNRSLKAASTFGDGSFVIKNISGSGEEIKSLSIDLSTTAIPEIVFDPNGTAGDNVAKTFTIDGTEGGAIGNVSFELRKPTSNGGFEQLVIFFGGTGSEAFSPGKSFLFSIDVDPSSIAGLPAPGPESSGAIAGIELIGATVSAEFNDQSVITSGLFNASNLVGSQVLLDPSIPPSMQLFAADLPSPSTTTDDEPVMQIRQGEPRAKVDLVILEGEKFGDLAFDEFETNSATNKTVIKGITLDSLGEADVPITILQDTNKVYYILVAQQFQDAYGAVSNPVILRFDEEITPGGFAVTSLDLVNADNGQVITTLSNNQVIDQSLTDGNRLTIVAKVNSADIKTVQMDLTGPLNVNALENFPPYALFGDGRSGGNIIYTGQFFPIGNYRIQATPFGGDNLTLPGEGLDFNFTLGGVGGGDTACTNLPSPWNSTNIGSVGINGKVCLRNQIFTVEGAGDNIWGQSDDFFYVYQDLNCDGEIIARINNIENTSSRAKAGVMIRESLSDNSRQAIMVLQPNGKAAFQYRAFTGGYMNNVSKDGRGTPRYVRLVRKGNTFTGFVSSNKVSWEQIGSLNISMGQNIKIGLAVTSRNPNELCTATFSQVEVTCEGDPSPDPEPDPTCGALPSEWSNSNIGRVNVSGKACYDNGNITLEGAGDNIWARSDDFYYVYQDLNCDGEIIAQLLSIENTNSRAKAGLMIRESLATDARQAILVLQPNGKAAFQYRSSVGEYMRNTSVDGRGAPRYIRLVRQGNTFTGYVSSNKVSWEQIGTATIPMGRNVKIGLAVTSRDPNVLCTAEFAQVEVKCEGNGEPDPNCGALPSEWANQDVGTGIAAGRACFDNNIYSVEGAGENIYGKNDEFHFVYQDLDCDGEIIAEVLSIQNTSSRAKAGVMIRETLSRNSRQAIMVLQPSGTAAFQYRAFTGGLMKNISIVDQNLPRYVRLVRKGNTFTGFVSTNKVTWRQVGSINITMGQSVKVGLAVTSRLPNILCKAEFAQVEVKCEGSPDPEPTCGTLPPSWLNSDIGDVAEAGETCFNNNTFEVTGGGADIWGTADEFHMAFRALNCEQGEIIALVSDLDKNIDTWTKGGVMIRESTTANSKYAYMLLSPGGGIAFQYRTTTGGFAESTTPIGKNPVPKYVRLRRDGDVFSGFVSDDKANWTLIGSVTMSMNSNVIMGLAVTSHLKGALAKGTFEDVSIIGCGGGTPDPVDPPDPTFMVFKLINAINDQVFDTPLTDGMLVNIGNLTRFNAKMDNLPEGTQSVEFEVLEGRFKSDPRSENAAPFSVFGDINGDFAERDADAGDSHRFRAEAYSGRNASGTLLESAEVGFTFVNSGGILLSEVINLNSPAVQAGPTILYIYPNQVSQTEVTVVISKPVRGNLSFTIRNMMGQMKAQGNIALDEPTDQLKLNMSSVSIEPGMYQLTIQGEDFVSQYPLVQK